MPEQSRSPDLSKKGNGTAKYGVCLVEVIGDSHFVNTSGIGCGGSREYCAAFLVGLTRNMDLFYRAVDFDDDGQVDGLGFRVLMVRLLEPEEDATSNVPFDIDTLDSEETNR